MPPERSVELARVTGMDTSSNPHGDTTRLQPGADVGVAPGDRHRVSLVVYHRNGAETALLRPGIAVTVGRLPPSDVAIADPSLSRVHARFTLRDGDVLVEDLGSTNGTLFRGSISETCVLAPGDEVQLGSVIAALHVLGASDPVAAGPLLGHDAFLAALESELKRARHFARTAALVMVRALERAPDSLRSFWPALQAGLAAVDVAGHYGPDTIELLLVEADAATAMARVRALAERPGALPLACGVAVFPACAGSADELVELARAAALTAKPGSRVVLAPADPTRTLSRAAPAEREPVVASAAMRAVIQLAQRLGRAELPVLLEGETGVGKELVARMVHESGPRRDGPLVCVNCATIPRELVESTLFGHERGAFSGASQQRKGVFEAASGGTVLLDEIGELPAAAQAALLRVLENKRFSRVGSTEEISVDVRVLAATHRDLEAMVEAGTFREDLLFRLNGMTLTIPPLRERRDDIRPLSLAFLREANEANGGAVSAISDEAMEALEAYAWPGNVRELRNALARAVVIAETDLVTPLDLPPRLRRAVVGVASEAPSSKALLEVAEGAAGDFRSRMEGFEARLLCEALAACEWSLPEAARRLQMPLRTLQHKVAAHGLRRR
jgi:DNA-binding NtrC family response regulator